MMLKNSFIDIDEHRIAYQRIGKGTPILLLHGITSYSFIWNSIIPMLSKYHEVIIMDLLGCGASDMPLDVSYALSAHEERIHRFITELGLSKFHLVGHDLGGGIAQLFAVHHPQYLISLTLMNSVAHDFWPVQPISAMRIPIVRELIMSCIDLGVFRILIQRGIFHREILTAELMAQFQKPLKTVAGRKAFKHFTKCLDYHNLTKIQNELAILTVPTQILRGDADPYLPAHISDFLKDTIPKSRFFHIATASHFIMLDEPDWVTNKILQFIKHVG
ncbi:MAG: alpha/beta hydrolase [Mariprofundales bacterium]